VDKVTLSIFANQCRAACAVMAETLYRTAHSTFVRETFDFTAGLTTPEGEMFAYSEEIAATWFVGLNLGPAIRKIPDYAEGDICITNDPYGSGFVCTQSPDTHLWMPIFYGGRLMAFGCCHVHNTDVGGAVPGSLSRTLSDVFQEGIRLPPLKLYRRGELNRELLEVFLANVRVPDQNWGDLKAQVAALKVVGRKVKEIIDRFGPETFAAGTRALLDHAEAQARAIIRSIPDGDYFFCDYVDEDAVTGNPLRLAVTMRVRGDELILDFTGTDPQLACSLNIPTGGNERHTVLLVALYHVFRTLDPNILLNNGVTRPIRCILPEGSIVNPQYPAAVGMRSLTGARLQDVLLGCLAQALPDRMPACASGSISMVVLNTVDPKAGRIAVATIEPMVGGGGGGPFRDGTNGVGGTISFLRNTPVEINEAEVPFEVLRYELITDSGGAGLWRGGLGTVLEFKVLSPGSSVTARNRDRTRFRPWGVAGGRAGKPSEFVLNPGTDREKNLGNVDVVYLDPGDVVRITSCGGGGWGDPYRRDPELVLRDVRQGFVSTEAAEREYGVVIRDGQADPEATERLRAGRGAKNPGAEGYFDFGPERAAYEAVWTRQMYDTLTELLWSVPVTWRGFFKARLFEAIENVARERAPTPEDLRAAFARIKAAFFGPD